MRGMQKKPDLVLGLATGSTPIPLYKEMVKDHQENGTSYAKVKTFNLDEYVGLPKEHPESYISFMTRNLFSHVDIDMKNVNIPYGLASDIPSECARYSALLDDVMESHRIAFLAEVSRRTGKTMDASV